MLTNAVGNPQYAWTERGFRTRFEYDALQRPLATLVSENGGTTADAIQALSLWFLNNLDSGA
jgi:YD repeat-containing protein